MTAKQLASVLKALQPTFQVVEGVYVLVTPGGSEHSAAWLRTNKPSNSEALKRFERDLNRCFIIANALDHLGLEPGYESEYDSLLTVAEVLEALIRAGLAREFPDQEFDVETIGAAGVEYEPLELCVTFSRGNGNK